jgi:hypothetical protein
MHLDAHEQALLEDNPFGPDSSYPLGQINDRLGASLNQQHSTGQTESKFDPHQTQSHFQRQQQQMVKTIASTGSLAANSNLYTGEDSDDAEDDDMSGNR